MLGAFEKMILEVCKMDMEELALCSDHIVHCDFDTPLMFSEDIVAGGLTYHANGVMKVPDTPGLGATIDQTQLDKLEKVVI